MSWTLQDLKLALEGEYFYDLDSDEEPYLPFDEEEVENVYDSIEYETVEIPAYKNFPGGTTKCIDNHGGEGEGDSMWVVFEVDGRLFRKNGYWVSYDGGYWDGELEEVEAYEKTVTDYRPITR